MPAMVPGTALNILLATSFFPPAHTAGTEQRTLSYAKALSQRGHQVQVLCVGNFEEGAPRYWNGHTDEIHQGIPVRRINLFWQKSPDPNGYLYRNPETARFFKQCLIEWQPELVHITSCLTLSASIIAVAKAHGLPVVVTLTDFWFLCHKLSLLKYDDSLCDGITTSRECIQCLSWNSGIYRNLKRVSSDAIAAQVLDSLSKMRFFSRMRVLRGMAPNISDRKAYLAKMLDMADALIAPSDHLRETMQRSGVSQEIRVIRSGHDLSWLDTKLQKLPGRRVRFGYIGQLIPPKGVHILLAAFDGCDWRDKAELHLFGNPRANPRYWEHLQQIGHTPGVVCFHEAFPHEQLAGILAGIDVLVVPSLWHENSPRVIQEAFASNTPVIASNVGGIAEYVQEGVNGFLFRRGDISDLKAVIEHIIQDPVEIQRLAVDPSIVRSLDDEIDEIESVYRQLWWKSQARQEQKQVWP